MKTTTFTDTLRNAIKDFPGGHNALARKTGVAQPIISRFVGGSDMKLSTVDRLAATLGIGITRRKSLKK